MIGNRNYWNQGYGSDAVRTLVKHLFRHTGLNRLHLKTLSHNFRAQHCFEKSGFKPQQSKKMGGYEFIIMITDRPRLGKGPTPQP